MAQPFTIYLTQSAHTDIGYTHPQEQIAWMYVDHYDRVLELCARDETAPAAQRYKWTCETAWQVRNYLAAKPERLDEFLYFVRNGQIEVTASFLHFTDRIDVEAYQYSLQWAVEFCREHGLPLRCAMHSDINGWPWALPDLLAEQGIPYFSSQVHIDSATDPLGRRGSLHYHWLLEHGDGLHPDTPIRIPQAFWWQGPGGKKTLHWLNEHYLLGNFLGLTGTHGFAVEKSRYFWESDRSSVDDLYALAQREVPRYVARLKHDGYPHDALLICSSGFFVDNSPPDDRGCKIVRRWNDEHEDILLRTATLSEWFEYLVTLETDSLPTRQVAWPDHWAHGLGTMSSRIAQARRVQRSREHVKALVEQSGSSYAARHLLTARDQELFAQEHTFNAWMTTEIPNAEAISFLQSAKELTFHRAELHYHEAVGAALRALTTPGGDQPFLYVPAANADDSWCTVEFTGADHDLDPDRQVLIADDGQVFRFQRESHALDMPRYVAALPTHGSSISRFHIADQPRPKDDTLAQSATRLENAAWRLQMDAASGGLVSLVEAVSGREWVGDQSLYRFGQLVHETVVHPLGRMAVGNRARMRALGVATESMRPSWIDAPIFKRVTPTFEGTPYYSPGGVFDAVQLKGVVGDLGRVEVAWRLYHTVPLVELVLDWDKRWNDLPEAAYVAFPFARAARLTFEAAGGFFQPGSHESGGQLAGTSSSYYTIQRAAHLQDDAEASLLWLPLDAPLVMNQALDYNRWETDPWSWNGFLASMPINHYWHTNFSSSQRGYLRFRYRFFSPHRVPDLESAIRAALPVEAFGWR